MTHGALPLPLRRLFSRSPWQRLPLLDRWLLTELIAPLLFGIAAFTAVSLSVGVVFDLVRRVAEFGLPAWAALQILMLKMPGFLVLSFPMATLMATLLAYSRLSSTSELTALRSVGVRAWRMVLPALALALAMSFMTFIFNDIVVPQSNLQAADTLERALGSAVAAERTNDTLYSNFSDVKNKNGKAGGTINKHKCTAPEFPDNHGNLFCFFDETQPKAWSLLEYVQIKNGSRGCGRCCRYVISFNIVYNIVYFYSQQRMSAKNQIILREFWN
jgi:hypothetical protein